MTVNFDKKTIEIVRVGESEYAEFCALLEWRRTGEENGDISAYYTNEIKEFFGEYKVFDSDNFFLFAAKVNGRFAGYATAVIIPKPDTRRGLLFVDELWVAEPYRLAGIGTLLMKDALALARLLKLWRVRLYVGMDNLAARNYYRKMGFSEKGDAVWCEMDVTSE